MDDQEYATADTDADFHCNDYDGPPAFVDAVTFHATPEGTCQDLTPPVPVCPGNVTVQSDGPNGVPASNPVVQAFLASVTVTDSVDPAPTLTNDAPAIFPIGETIVTFTATDAAGNVARCANLVTVNDARARLDDPEAAKAAVECQKQADAAGAKLVAGTLNSLEKCSQSLLTCAQTIDADKHAKCEAKASAGCTRSSRRSPPRRTRSRPPYRPSAARLRSPTRRTTPASAMATPTSPTRVVDRSWVRDPRDVPRVRARLHRRADREPRSSERPCAHDGCGDRERRARRASLSREPRRRRCRHRRFGDGEARPAVREGRRQGDHQARGARLQEPRQMPRDRARVRRAEARRREVSREGREDLQRAAREDHGRTRRARGRGRRQCTAAGFATLAAADGAGLGALASDCGAVGVTPDSVPAYATCLTRSAVCAAEDAVALAAPRSAATFGLGGVRSGQPSARAVSSGRVGDF